MAHLEKSNRLTHPKSLETPTVSLSPLHALLLAPWSSMPLPAGWLLPKSHRRAVIPGW
ncbi:MAG: hypothetical protein CM1200mP2_12950 [Planctomycetaceae bacterium]|nr:MAG: hypothetical protein CM1200mP2_12950 [Planctomycetaceae bacterium]